MATSLKKDTGIAVGFYSISASDINHRKGDSDTTTLSLGSLSTENLFFHPKVTTVEMSYSDFKNKTRMVTGNYFSTTGFIFQFQGSTNLGSITEKNLASSNTGGWHWNSSTNFAFISELWWSSSSSVSTYSFRPRRMQTGSLSNLTNDQGWSTIKIRKDQQGTAYVKSLSRTSSYASFVSSSGAWRWSSGEGSPSDLGYGSNLTRDIEID